MKHYLKTISYLILLGGLIPTASAQPVIPGAQNSRDCAQCHLQWTEQFNNPQAILLIDKPPEQVEAASETCLSCHDGSMVDSRRRVWLEHSHQTNITPPPDMTIPDILPLKDGKITCRTCHTAHADTGPETLGNTVMLRVPNETSQLCQLCHTDKKRRKGKHNQHPLGEIKERTLTLPLDKSRLAYKTKRIFCQVCHTAHGSRQDHLLVLAADNNRLCLSCHPDMRPGMWRKKKGLHPDRPVIHVPEQVSAIRQMHTRLGRDNRLICLSCHKIHNSPSRRFLLAMPLQNSEFCIQCHPRQKELLQTAHNLTKVNHPPGKKQDTSTENVGPCSRCHKFHHLAIEPEPSTFDPEGMCVSCHRHKGQVAMPGKKLGDMLDSHPLNIAVPARQGDSLPLFRGSGADKPEMTCRTCHNPHSDIHGQFLRQEVDILCSECHNEYADNLRGGKHDRQFQTEAWSTYKSQEGRCRNCHKTHAWNGQENRTLWTVAPVKNKKHPHDGVCLACHGENGWAQPSQPSGASPGAVLHPWVSLDDKDHNPEKAYMQCQTCHAPHAKADRLFMLKYKPQGEPREVCLGCHEDARPLSLSMHNAEFLKDKQKQTLCGPCHVIHTTRQSRPDMLWESHLSSQGANESEKRCLGCHGPNGPARQPATMLEHPEPVLMQGVIAQWSRKNISQYAGAPLQKITCIVCHVPHGRILPDTKDAKNVFISPRQLAAMKPMLRERVAEKLCSRCHNFSAARLFLYYHYPEKR